MGIEAVFTRPESEIGPERATYSVAPMFEHHLQQRWTG